MTQSILDSKEMPHDVKTFFTFTICSFIKESEKTGVKAPPIRDGLIKSSGKSLERFQVRVFDLKPSSSVKICISPRSLDSSSLSIEKRD